MKESSITEILSNIEEKLDRLLEKIG